MKGRLSGYSTLVFDCDGVVLDSNKVKTRAFYEAALPYGEAAAEALVKHHVANGGISRYKKFSWFCDNIAQGLGGPGREELLKRYAEFVLEGLLTCESAPGLEQLRAATPNSRWLIVSGGDQAELRDVFAQRGLLAFFDGGIFGSPDTKDDILARELKSGNITQPALFLGDSKYDYQAASQAGLDFVFVSGWTEVEDWQNWASTYSLVCRPHLGEVGDTA